MGRPRALPEDMRDCRTSVLYTAAERAELESRAATFGLTLSDYIRRQTLGRPLPAGRADQALRAKLATSLLRLGVNLNQVAKHMNAGRAEPSFLPDLIAEIRGHVTRLSLHEPGQDRHG